MSETESLKSLKKSVASMIKRVKAIKKDVAKVRVPLGKIKDVKVQEI